MSERQKIIAITPAQYEIIQACLSERNVSAICGRRFGKTELALFLLLFEACNTKNYIGYYLATSAEQVKRIVYDRLYKTLLKQNIKKANEGIGSMEFELKNGSKIYLKGSGNPNSLRGGAAHRIILDEAADQPPDIIDTVLNPMLADYLGRLLVIGTQRGLGNWVNDLKNRPHFTNFIKSSYDGNLIPHSELDRLRETMDDIIFRTEIMAEAVASTGCVYYAYSEKNISTQTFNPNLDVTLSFDFNVNPMTITMFQFDINQFNAHVAVKEFVLKNSNTESASNHIKYFLQSNGFKGCVRLTGDFSGNQRRSSSTKTDWIILQEAFRQYAPDLDYCKIRRTRSIRDRVNYTNQALSQNLVKINPLECPILAKELNVIEWKEDGCTINDQFGVMGHASDNFSYFCYNFKPLNTMQGVLL